MRNRGRKDIGCQELAVSRSITKEARLAMKWPSYLPCKVLFGYLGDLHLETAEIAVEQQ